MQLSSILLVTFSPYYTSTFPFWGKQEFSKSEIMGSLHWCTGSRCFEQLSILFSAPRFLSPVWTPSPAGRALTGGVSWGEGGSEGRERERERIIRAH